MDIYILSTIGECSTYEPKQKGSVSIVISPIRLEGTEANLKVISGCNMWRSCQNTGCQFSFAARQGPRMEKRQILEANN